MPTVNIRAFSHKKSTVVENGGPKLPTAAQLELGEIAMNFAKGYETLSIKNNNNEIVTFTNDNYWINKELAIAAALNDLNDRVDNKQDALEIDETPTEGSLGVVTSGGLYSYITEIEQVTAAALNDLDNRITSLSLSDDYVAAAQGTPPLAGDTYETAISKLHKVILDDELITSSALNDLNDKYSNIEIPTKTSDLTNDSNFIRDKFVGYSSIIDGAINNEDITLTNYGHNAAININPNGIDIISNWTGNGNSVDENGTWNVYVNTSQGKAYYNSKEIATVDQIVAPPVTSVNGATGAVTVKANVQSDWNATTGDAVILNKPKIENLDTGLGIIFGTKITGLTSEFISLMGDIAISNGSDATIRLGRHDNDDDKITLTSRGSDGGIDVITDNPFTYNNKEIATVDQIITPPVTSVNGMTGAVTINIPQSLLLKGVTPQGHTLADAADSYYAGELNNGEAGAWFISYSNGDILIKSSDTSKDQDGRVCLSSSWASRLNYGGMTWANVGDILLVYKQSALIVVYKVMSINEAGETRIGLMSPNDKIQVNKISNIEGNVNNLLGKIDKRLPYSTDSTNIGNAGNGAYTNVTSGRTNWLDTSSAGAAIKLGNLQIAVDNSGRLYSRNQTNNIWNLTNQLKTISETDLNNVFEPSVIGYATVTNGPSETGNYTVYTLTSSDYDGNGFRSILQIAINRNSGNQYMRTCFKKVDGSGTDFTSTDWKLISSSNELSSSYAPSTLTNEDLELAAGDTYEEAFGKLEKTINDNENITAAALTDLDSRLNLLHLPQSLDDIPDGSTRKLATKQDTLVSGTNIKTINNESILGSGNITIQGGGDVNVIEGVKVNGTLLTPDSNKSVDIPQASASGFGVVRMSTDSVVNNQSELNNAGLTGVYGNALFVKAATTTQGGAMTPAMVTKLDGLSAVTESTVSGWGFTKNTGTYSKPSGGIPLTDLAAAVQTSLGKADSALQEAYYVTNVTVSEPYPVGEELSVTANHTAEEILAAYNDGKLPIVMLVHGEETYGMVLPLLGITKSPFENDVYGFYFGASTNALSIFVAFLLNGEVVFKATALATTEDVPTKTSELDNDSGFITEAPVTSVNGQTGAVNLTIPAAVTESTVSGWGFTKNSGTYSKPSGGIPKSDLASAVQTSLGKADTALQSFTETDPTVPSYVKGITTTDISNWNSKQSPLLHYSESLDSSTNTTTIIIDGSYGTNDAIKITDTPSGSNYVDISPSNADIRVITDTSNNKKLYYNSNEVATINQLPTFNYVFKVNSTNGVYLKVTDDGNQNNDYATIIENIISSSDPHDGWSHAGNSALATVGLIKTKIDAKYTKPSTGISKTDLANAVQTSLGLADTALQSHQNIKSLNTNNTTAQTASASETIAGSGTINLHKVAKTGSYDDLLDKPTIPTTVTESTVSGWGFTKNAGTITGITMNGSSKGTSGVVNLGTVLTSETSLSKGTTSGSGNAVTDISVNGHTITLTKGSTFLTSHQNIKTINNNSLVGTGNISIDTLPTVTASDNGKVLQVVNGAWSLVMPTAIYSGTSTPNNSVGNNGDLYL